MDRINEWRYRNINIANGQGNWYNAAFPNYVLISDRAVDTAEYAGAYVDVTGTYNTLYANNGARVYDSPTYRLFWTGQWNTTVVT